MRRQCTNQNARHNAGDNIRVEITDKLSVVNFAGCINDRQFDSLWINQSLGDPIVTEVSATVILPRLLVTFRAEHDSTTESIVAAL